MTTRRAVRRRTVWSDTFISFNLTNNAQELVGLLLGFAQENVQGLTLTRVLLHLDLGTDVAPAAFGIQAMAMAIGVVSSEAFGASVVPEADVADDAPSLPWVWRDRLTVWSQTDVTAVNQIASVRADLRAQRKLTETSQLFFVADSTLIGGTTFTLRCSGLIRCLFLMP